MPHMSPLWIVTLFVFSLNLIDAAPWLSSPVGVARAERKKIAFMAGTPSHGYAAHEHYAGCMLLAKSLKHGMPNLEVVVYRNGWPQDPAAFEDVDTIVMYCDGGARHPAIQHLDQIDRLTREGVGIVCLHYAVEVPKGEAGDKFLDWIGGYFEPHWSVNPHWTAKFQQFPDHPITRGVEPFEIHDEWYYHMRFREAMNGVTPVLTALPPKETLSRPDGHHSGNPQVRAAVLERKEPQHVAWASEQPEGGRGFGFTGGHFHWNWGDRNFRKLVLNAIVWTANAEVPSGGVVDEPLTLEGLEANQDYPQPKNFDREGVRRRLNLPGDADEQRDPKNAVNGLDVTDGLETTLFASEPDLLSLTNLDVDHRGRIWVCEVVNYRRNEGQRPEGDRILILEDTDGDGQANTKKTYYQGRDIDSAMGICVLGNRVIVSCSPNIWVFTDLDGDDRPDRKELLFTKTGQPQHDHSAHSFLFGPDGKLYWNFGNTGEYVHDKDGNPVIDLAGNRVVDNGKPYFGGMVFRCNPDGSQFEVLGHNFRNSYEVTVDSFGTLWQSDNDDDGNRGVRINYVMEFGNFGYRDEMTGASWKTPRTGMHAEIPLRHWHQNDPGVVPNVLGTGAGSPTGISVYEGRLLPRVFWDQMIHCDAGPNVVRAYPVKPDSAGYAAEIVNLVHGARDNWFRPADVCVAPDGSLFVTDWYDPGVGGHNMQDLERGRLFRVAPPGHKYHVPQFDFRTAEGAVEALKNPNPAVRYLAWTALHTMGRGAEPALEKLRSADNVRYRARALWLLGKIDGRGEHYVSQALADQDENVRILGIRLACQLQLDVLQLDQKLVSDPSPQVRRQLAIALRHNESPHMPHLWAELAMRHDGRDRWYLEALGIGADRQWDACFAAWLNRVGDNWNTRGGRDIVWRSRAVQTADYLARIITDPQTLAEELPRYFRAFDFLPAADKRDALDRVVRLSTSSTGQRQSLIAVESLLRLDRIQGADHSTALGTALEAVQGTSEFVTLVDKFNVASRYTNLLTLAQDDPDSQLGVEAIRALLARNERRLILRGLESADMQQAIATVRALGNSGHGRATSLILPLVGQEQWDLELRRQAARAAAQLRNGASALIELAKSGQLDERLKAAAAFSLNSSPWPEISRDAAQFFPLPPTQGDEPLPPIARLVNVTGNAVRGRDVFVTNGQCANCHVVQESGKEVGPNLSEIGAKLSRAALWESIIYPNAGINHNYETHIMVLNSGAVLTGILVSETADTISLKSKDAIVRTLAKSEIEELVKSNASLMPDDLPKAMTLQDLADVVDYLCTLRPR